MEEIFKGLDGSVVMCRLTDYLQKKRITISRLSTLCAYWLLNSWDDVQIYNYPYRTEEIAEYEAISPGQRKKLKSSYFQDNPKILEYYEKLKWTFHKNIAWIEHLEEFKSALKPGDIANQEKYQRKIIEFKNKLKEHEGDIESVRDIAKEFNGEVILSG